MNIVGTRYVELLACSQLYKEENHLNRNTVKKFLLILIFHVFHNVCIGTTERTTLDVYYVLFYDISL